VSIVYIIYVMITCWQLLTTFIYHSTSCQICLIKCQKRGYVYVHYVIIKYYYYNIHL
jgi:hypothetical protein